MKGEALLNRGQLARALDCSNRHLGDLLAAGVIAPVVAGKGRRAAVFDALVSIPAVLRAERQKSSNGSARDRAYLARAALDELKLALQRREVVSRDEVMQACSTVILAARDRLLKLSYTLERRGGLAPGGAAIVDEEVRAVLTELSRLRAEEPA